MTAVPLDLQLHLERSRCINAFVDVEKALIALTEKLAPGYENELLSPRIKRLRDVPASPAFSKEQRKLLSAALDEAEELSAVRNDMVHGALTVLNDGAKPVAAFVNARQTDTLAPIARLLTVDQLKQIANKAHQLAARLEKVLLKPRQPAAA